MDQFREFLKEENRAKLIAQLSSLKNFSLQKNLTLVFCGTFSSGKTSLINQLLDEKLELPTGPNPVTKLVTRIIYGEKLQCEYVCEGKNHSLSISRLKQAIVGNFELPGKCSEVIIKVPARILKDGIEILDTPGYLDNANLTEITRTAVLTADVAFFCCNAVTAGKKFELDYFGELEECIGNFCVVVNKVDHVNSKEEFFKLKNFIEFNVANRGNFNLQLVSEKNIFYTIAGGQHFNLDGLKELIFYICTTSRKKFIRKLKIYSSEKKIIYKLRLMTQEIKQKIDLCNFLSPILEEELEAEYQKNLKIYLAERDEISAKINKIFNNFEKILNDTVTQIEHHLDFLEKMENSYWWDFQEKANNYLKKSLRDSVKELENLLQKNFPQLNFDKKNLFKYYLSKLEVYSVPSPVGKSVKVREGGQRIIRTIVNFISLDFSIDDGYRTKYEGYADVAKLHMKENLIPKLKLEIIEYRKKIETIAFPIRPEKNIEFLQKVAENKNQWQKLNTEIDEFLTSRLKDFSLQNVERKLFPHF